jgi:hypothetical protein
MGLKIDVLDKHWNKELKREGFAKHMLVVSNVGEAVDGILKLLKKHKGEKIARLRFFGHGMPGCQLVGVKTHDAKGNKIAVDLEKHKLSLLGYLDASKSTLLNQGKLQDLKGHFVTEKGFFDQLFSTAPPAVVELRGCNVAADEIGKKLLKQLSQLWQVAVRGAVETQSSGDASTTNDWEGTVYQAVNGKEPIALPPSAARN